MISRRHDFRLDGIEAARDHFLGDSPKTKWDRFAHALPSNLGGRSVLDIGSNAGFYAITGTIRRDGIGVRHRIPAVLNL